jgi:hypothetical protein
MPVAIADKPNPTNRFLDTSLIKNGTTQLDIKNTHPTIIVISIMFVLVVRTRFERAISPASASVRYQLAT